MKFIFSFVLATVALLGAETIALAQAAQVVPSADKVSAAITRYTRVRPALATAGVLKEGGVSEAKALGFATILDLRGPEEGTEVERRAAEAAGLRYLNIPVTEELPSEAQVVAFARIVEDAASHAPLLVHCASANRVGAMWSLYRVRGGATLAQAVAEGRTIGMQKAREDAVLRRLQPR